MTEQNARTEDADVGHDPECELCEHDRLGMGGEEVDLRHEDCDLCKRARAALLAPEGTGITDAELNAMQARADAATEGPWTARIYTPGKQEDGTYSWNDGGSVRSMDGQEHIASLFTAADAEFMASARTDVPRLIAEVRRLRERLGDQKETSK